MEWPGRCPSGMFVEGKPPPWWLNQHVFQVKKIIWVVVSNIFPIWGNDPI